MTDTRKPIPLDEQTIKRLIRRIVDRRLEWSSSRHRRRKDETWNDYRARMERAASVAILEYDWREGWDKIPDGTRTVFGRQQLRTARDVPTSVVHSLMCRMDLETDR